MRAQYIYGDNNLGLDDRLRIDPKFPWYSLLLGVSYLRSLTNRRTFKINYHRGRQNTNLLNEHALAPT